MQPPNASPSGHRAGAARDDAAGWKSLAGFKQLDRQPPEILDPGDWTGPGGISAAPLRRFAPDLVILVDAALMGEASRLSALAGLARHLGYSSSTHSLPLCIFCGYLAGRAGLRGAPARHPALRERAGYTAQPRR